MRTFMLAIAFLTLWVTRAQGDASCWVSSGAVAEGDSVRIGVTVFGGTQLAGQSVVIEASMLGSCDDVAIVTPNPVPIAAVDAEQSFTFRIRPATLQRIYFYRAKLIDASGTISNAPSWVYYSNGSYVSCGEAIAARGSLWTWLCGDPQQVCIVNCASQCWAACGSMVQFPADSSTWDEYINTGQVLDFYGEVMRPPVIWTMPGTPCMVITRIAPVTDPAGCAAVSEQRTSWGGVKAMYR